MAEGEARPEAVRGKRRCVKRADEEGADHGNGKREVRTWFFPAVSTFFIRSVGTNLSETPIFLFSDFQELA